MVGQPASLQERIAGALVRARNAKLGQDVVSADQVRDVATTTEGRVRLTLVLDPADDAALVGQVRAAVWALEGVRYVRADVKDISATADPSLASAPPAPKPMWLALLSFSDTVQTCYRFGLGSVNTSTERSKARRSPGPSAPTSTIWRPISSPFSFFTVTRTIYSQFSPTSGCLMEPST